MTDLSLFGPPSEDPSDELMHYGIKGMQWGKRRPDGPDGTVSSGPSSSKESGASSTSSSSGSKQGMTDGQKKALKYAAGGALAVGGVIAVGILAKNGKIPIKSLQLSTINKNSLAAQTKKLSKLDGFETSQQKANHAAAQKLMSSMSKGQKGITPSKNPIENLTRIRLADEAAIRNNAAQAAQQAAQRQATTSKGKEAVEALKTSAALKKSIDDFRKQIEEDHKAQTKYMIDDSAKAGLPYNAAKDNPYSPESRSRK